MYLGDDVCALIQNMVRARVRANWPSVLAHEYEKRASFLHRGDFVRDDPAGELWFGQVISFDVGRHVLVDWFREVPNQPLHLVKHGQQSCVLRATVALVAAA